MVTALAPPVIRADGAARDAEVGVEAGLDARLDLPSAGPSLAAELHHVHQRALVRLATLLNGDVEEADRLVRAAFVRLALRRRSADGLDGATALAGVRRTVLRAGSRRRPPHPAAAGAVDGLDGVLALPRHERDLVVLHSYAGLDTGQMAAVTRYSRRATARRLGRGLGRLRATGFAEADVVAALHAAVADVEPVDGGWAAVLLDVGRRRRRRRRPLLVAAALSVVALVAVSASPSSGEGGRAERVQVLPDGPRPATGLPPLPPVAVVLADRRVVRIDPSGTVSPIELGLFPTGPSPLQPGDIELSATPSDVLAGADHGNEAIVGFGGGWHGGVVAMGHSPAISRDGRSAWVQDGPGGLPTVVVSAGVRLDRYTTPAGAATPTTVRRLSWAPVATQLAFEMDTPTGPPEVVVLDTDRPGSLSDGRRITAARAPRWLPDGNLLAVDSSTSAVHVIDPGSGQSVAHQVDGAPSVSVDADGHGNLLALHADGSLTVNGRVLRLGVVAATWQQ